MNTSKEYVIRPLVPSDQTFLREMLYQSLYVPDGGTPFERSILDQPDIARYVEEWGREDDSGFVAINKDNEAVGAIWLRLFKKDERGFGYVDAETPEMGMAVLPAYRNRGIGTSLLARLIASAENFYEYISLSVAAGNPALRLYRRLGFEAIAERDGSITMTRKLKNENSLGGSA